MIGKSDSPRFGLHFSEVAIQGDHVKDVEHLFAKLKYRIVRKNWVVGWSQFNSAIDKQPSKKDRVRKAVYLSNGWTHIVDPELVMFSEEKVLARESRLLHAKIVTWLSESTSDSYGFSAYENGRLLRAVLNLGGKVEARGSRLPAEQQAVWKDAGEDKILEMAKRLGPGFNPEDEKVKVTIYDLDELP